MSVKYLYLHQIFLKNIWRTQKIALPLHRNVELVPQQCGHTEYTLSP